MLSASSTMPITALEPTLASDLLSKEELSQIIHNLFKTTATLAEENRALRTQLAIYQRNDCISKQSRPSSPSPTSKDVPPLRHDTQAPHPDDSSNLSSFEFIHSRSSSSSTSTSRLDSVVSPMIPYVVNKAMTVKPYAPSLSSFNDSDSAHHSHTLSTISAKDPLLVMHLLCKDILKILWTCTHPFITVNEADKYKDQVDSRKVDKEIRQSIPNVPVQLTPTDAALIVKTVEERLVQLSTQLLSTQSDFDILAAHIQSYYQHMAIDRVVRREQLTKTATVAGQTNATAHAGSGNNGGGGNPRFGPAPGSPSMGPASEPTFEVTSEMTISLGVDSNYIRRGQSHSINTGGDEYAFGDGALDFGGMHDDKYITGAMGYADPEMMQLFSYEDLEI